MITQFLDLTSSVFVINLYQTITNVVKRTSPLSLLSVFLIVLHIWSWGTRWRSWLRHCASSRKVAGSIPDGVIGIFHWHNPSGCTMALGLTQPLTEMSTRNISWGWKRPVRRADNLTTFMCRLSWNLGASTSWNPQGLSRPVMGLLYIWRYVRKHNKDMHLICVVRPSPNLQVLVSIVRSHGYLNTQRKTTLNLLLLFVLLLLFIWQYIPVMANYWHRCRVGKRKTFGWH